VLVFKHARRLRVSNVIMDRDGFYYNLTSDDAPIDHLHFHKTLPKKWVIEDWKVAVTQIYIPLNTNEKRTLQVFIKWTDRNLPSTQTQEVVKIEITKDDNKEQKVNELFQKVEQVKENYNTPTPWNLTLVNDATVPDGKMWQIHNENRSETGTVSFNSTLCRLLGMSYPHKLILPPTPPGNDPPKVTLTRINNIQDLGVLFKPIPNVLKLHLDFVETRGMSDEDYDNDILVRWNEQTTTFLLYEAKHPQYRDVIRGPLTKLGIKFKNMKEEDLFDYKVNFKEGKEFNTRITFHFKPALKRIYKSVEPPPPPPVVAAREVTPVEAAEESTDVSSLDILKVEEKQGGGSSISIFDVEKNAGF